jgi:methionyl aminopeptidase
MNAFGRGPSIPIRSAKDIEKMRASCRLAASVLEWLEPKVQPGVSTAQIDAWCHAYILDHRAYPSPLNYPGRPIDPHRPYALTQGGFPASVCTSINEVVCHGIPSETDVLAEGDIVNVDITVTLDGWFGDTSKTFVMPGATPEVEALVQRTQECLYAGIRAVADGSRYRRFNDIGRAIQEIADAHGYGVVREFVGHGIGDTFHHAPNVLHYRTRNAGAVLKPGYIFTIEPMINLGTHENSMLDDGWTAVTDDAQPSAQFEHTCLVTAEGIEVLTLRAEEAGAGFNP